MKLICNCKESNIMKSGRDLSYHNSHQSWLCSNATSGVENFTNFKALLQSGKGNDDGIQVYCDHLVVLKKGMQEKFQDNLTMKIPYASCANFLHSRYLLEGNK
ncbi:putative pullulanase [Trichinella spiralis]|uniref:putative pullulanase n=1 Tax=Trichinella spiralis TaxID=6334 RepID=UPI0001EFD876|nr:putative pullulanase [Trichinella spiralis]